VVFFRLHFCPFALKVRAQIKSLLEEAMQHPEVGGSLHNAGGHASGVKIEYTKWRSDCYLPMVIWKKLAKSGEWLLDNKKFYNLLVDKNMLFAKALFHSFSGACRLANYGKLSQYLSVMLPVDDFCSFLCHRIRFEISLAKNANLFRNGSAATKLFQAFGKVACQSYLQKMALRAIAKVIEIVKTNKIDGPVRHAKVTESLPDSLSPVTEVARILLDDIIQSIDDFPPVLRRVCCVMHSAIQEQFPGDDHLTNMPVGMVMLRLLNPSLIDPMSIIPTQATMHEAGESFNHHERPSSASLQMETSGSDKKMNSISGRVKAGLKVVTDRRSSKFMGLHSPSLQENKRNSDPWIPSVFDLPSPSPIPVEPLSSDGGVSSKSPSSRSIERGSRGSSGGLIEHGIVLSSITLDGVQEIDSELEFDEVLL
jgi:hypothetical protein